MLEGEPRRRRLSRRRELLEPRHNARGGEGRRRSAAYCAAGSSEGEGPPARERPAPSHSRQLSRGEGSEEGRAGPAALTGALRARHGALACAADHRRRLPPDLRQLPARRGRRHPMSNHRPAQGLMATQPWTRYKLQRKLFAVGEDFWIENDQGEAVFKGERKPRSLPPPPLAQSHAGTPRR